MFPEPPHTNAFRLWLPYPAEKINDAVLALAEEEKVWFAGNWQDSGVPGVAMVEITTAASSIEWTAKDIADVGARLLDRLN